MQVRMLGIDHNLASLEVREKLAFSKKQASQAMADLASQEGVSGCLILSTCNRTELWVSCKEEAKISMLDLLGLVKEEAASFAEDVTVERQGDEAIGHLLSTACGLNSMVFGEEQILSQIRDALDLARQAGTASSTIERVFQTAVAAAKEVKNSLDMGSYKPSVASQGLSEIEAAGYDLKDKNCLVIGNGKMGELVANHLVSKGAKVKMTLRKSYHHGDDFESLMPKGCQMIDYYDRYQALANADIVISATMSPHHTLTRAKVAQTQVKTPALWLDLAVPRDIDPNISKEIDVKILDIDSLGACGDEAMKETRQEAMEILGYYKDNIKNWLDFRQEMPMIMETIKLTKKDIFERLRPELKDMGLTEDQEKILQKKVRGASGRAVNKLLCGLKNSLDQEDWDKVFSALLESAKKETLKS